MKKQKKSNAFTLSLTIRLFIGLFFVGINSAFAGTLHSQSARFTLNLDNVSIKEFCSSVEKNSNYVFLYKNKNEANVKVSVNAKNETLEEILDKTLPAHSLAYKINDRQVVIYEKESNQQVKTQDAGKIIVKGNVSDAKGEVLIGVNVSVDKTSVGTVTDIDGNYSIAIPNTSSTLVFTYLGYTTQKQQPGNRKIVNVTMIEGDQELAEVVVTGYTTQKKASVVGAVQTIQPGELKVPSAQLSTGFAGRLAGVIAVQRSGQPGADAADFWIRGVSTFNEGATAPLIILDGVQITMDDLNAIDPEVIDQFSILKDATTSALYGTRGANGVMIITTKTGRDQLKPSISARFETTINTPTKVPQIVGGVDYMNLYNEAVKYRQESATLYSDEKITRTRDGWDPLLYPNVDWYKELFNNYSYYQNANLNVRGGSSSITYFLSATINHESGMLKNRSKEFFSFDNNIDVWRFSFQNNLTAKLSNTTKVGLKMNARMNKVQGPSVSVGSVFSNVMNSNPVDFPAFFPNDDPREPNEREWTAWGAREGQTDANPNPLAQLVKGYNSEFETNLIINMDLDQDLKMVTPGLSAKLMASFRSNAVGGFKREAGANRYYISPANSAGYTFDSNNMLESYALAPYKAPAPIVLAPAAVTADGGRTIYLQASLNYERTFNKRHGVSGLLLYNQEEYEMNFPRANENTSEGTGNTMSINLLPKRKLGWAGRATYSLDSKYLVEFNAGYNGSENFAPGHRFGFFPSVGLGYIISEEGYWKNLKHIISNLKLRGSWGKVGNDQIGAAFSAEQKRFVYMAIVQLQQSPEFVTGLTEDGKLTMKGPTYDRFQNNNITWEVGTKINVGLDMEILHNLSLVVDVFKEHRENIFMKRRTIPAFFGTSKTDVYGNLGEVENKGLDLSLTFDKKLNKDLFISARGTFTYAKNKILAQDESPYALYPNLSQVGYPVNQIQMYIAERLFIDYADIKHSPEQSGTILPGDIKYKDIEDVNGVKNRKIGSEDKVYDIGYPTKPQIVYGFGANAQYKKFDFGFFFQGVGQTSLMMSGFHPFGTSTTRSVLQFVADSRYNPDNQDIYASYPALTKQDRANTTNASTYWLRDASFLKLKNAEIGYTYKKCRFYVNGSNLLTISKFKLWDPEQGGGAGFKYPTQIMFNLGAQIKI